MTGKIMSIFTQLRLGLIQLLALAVAVSTLQSTVVFAQQAVQDFEAPLIEHELLKSGELGEAQIFSANVVDNIELKSVSIFYRFTGVEQFEQIPMEPVSTSSFFSATIPTEQLPIEETSIEYYLQAEDVAGNIVLKGYIFDPLIRTLRITASGADTQATSTTIEESGTAVTDQPVPKKKSRTLYYVLGALGLVALAGLAASSSGGSDDPVDESCVNSVCMVNLQVEQP